MVAPLEEDTDLQVEELAVPSVDNLGTAIAPAHLDDVHLVGETRQQVSNEKSLKRQSQGMEVVLITQLLPVYINTATY